MRSSKILILIFVFISFAFLHVFLQTETIKLGYSIKKTEDKFQELIDYNNVLKYNIYTLESPNSLNKYVLVKNASLKSLRPVQVFGLGVDSRTNAEAAQEKRKGLFDGNPVLASIRKILEGQAEAQVNTIK